MSFSSEVKEELSKLNTFGNKNLIYSELYGYILSGNTKIIKSKINFSTNSDYNINRFGKILTKLEIDYKIKVQGKNYIIYFNKECLNLNDINISTTDEKKAVIRGAFMGGGLINNPNSKYHLEITFNSKENQQIVQDIISDFDIITKSLIRKNGYSLYIKEGEFISDFLAVIGANTAVIRYEEIRVIKDKRNNINRIVNCETANLNKTIEASVLQIQAINLIKSKRKFEDLPENLKEIAELRLKNPDANLVELGEMLNTPISKSGVNHRLNKLLEMAKELKEKYIGKD